MDHGGDNYLQALNKQNNNLITLWGEVLYEGSVLVAPNVTPLLFGQVFSLSLDTLIIK